MTEVLTLTPGQAAGYDKFLQFYLDPMQTVMQLKGYSGTGKSTLIARFISDLPMMNNMARLVAPDWVEKEVVLTATTNQAAEALRIATGNQYEVRTVHSALGLRVVTDYRSGKKSLVTYNDGIENCLLVVDEASFIDQELLGMILRQAKKCKIVFTGDPDQITPISDPYMPAFELNACEVELTELMRFKNGPLMELVTGMRMAVRTGKWERFKLSPGIIDHMKQADFEALAHQLFKDPATANTTKILAYTNDCVTYYNNLLSKAIMGTTAPLAGQRMLVNEAVQNNGSRCSTNEEVFIESIESTVEYGVSGYEIKLKGKASYYFMPERRGAKAAAHAKAVDEDNFQMMKIILDTWIDLRPSFACTVNKAQGSTYEIILIDLNDICSKISTVELLARILYVATSRGRQRVIFTGDLRRT